MATLKNRGLISAILTILLISPVKLSQAQETNTSLSLYFDPGPSHLCYDFGSTDANNDFYQQSDYSQCSGITDNAPAWSFSWFGADYDFDGFTSGSDGEPITVTLITDAQGLGDCGTLYETNLSYAYPGFALRKLPDDGQINLADYEQWVVEYDVTVRTGDPNTPGCVDNNGKWQRKYVTTDFIYYWTQCDDSNLCEGFKNVISIIHYNPIETDAAQGPYEEGGFRLQVDGPPTLTEGVQTHVALDFKNILLTYSSELCHGGVMPGSVNPYALQIVSSNVNTSSTIDIKNMQFSLLNNISNPVTYPLPTYPTGLTPSYCPPLNNTCHVQYTITSTWTTGYTVDLVLQNTGLYPLSSWTLDFDLPAQDTVTSYWEADVTQEGQGVVATNTSSNGALAVGQTVDFGFNAGSEDGLGATIPSVFMIGAVACSVN